MSATVGKTLSIDVEFYRLGEAEIDETEVNLLDMVTKLKTRLVAACHSVRGDLYVKPTSGITES